jgi:colanic acid/amylovoran biosynthesis glycosyltransferase
MPRPWRRSLVRSKHDGAVESTLSATPGVRTVPGERTVRVVHSVPIWLPLTEVWMKTQIEALPPNIVSHVVSDRTINLDKFPIANLHALDQGNRPNFVVQKAIRRLGLRRDLPGVFSTYRSVGADVLHSHFGPTGAANAAAAHRLGIPHVITFYGFDVGRLPRDPRWRQLYAETFASTDCVLAVGPEMRRRIIELGCPPEKVVVHNLGVHMVDLAYAPRVLLPGEPLRVLIAAAFREKKGIPDAIAAVAALANEQDVRLTIVGDAIADPASVAEKERIVATIRGSGIADRTSLRGFLAHDQLIEEAHHHHVLLAPSLEASDGDIEGTPMALVELAATGMPIVSTEHGDIRQVVVHRDTGWLVAEHNVSGLVAGLRWLVENEPSWPILAANARARMEAMFDSITQGKELATIYAGLIDG